MAQQTAVEYLFEQLWNTPIDKFTWNAILEKAKEMEKEKMIDAIIFSEREHYIMGECWPTQTVIDKAERYYNETFKND